jgi:hypothetical protein
MAERQCPFCGAKSFYVKDPEDQYEIFEFDLQGGQVQFKPQEDCGSSPPIIGEETETYCGLCSWHGKFNTLKRG